MDDGYNVAQPQLLPASPYPLFDCKRLLWSLSELRSASFSRLFHGNFLLSF
ncbi:hypothetical protein GCWU000341_01150 [Oribacterium sp. oral taxon 078 str. F0262]|nr:hypothetical protein GCWU000341_01150 [Oribacterium sp. oral taxon 078 str. F0262]